MGMRNMALFLAGAVASTIAGPVLEIYRHRPEASAFYAKGSGMVLEAERGTAGSYRDSDGMFYLDGHLGETSIRFLVDTGASHIVLSHQAARALGAVARPAGAAVLATVGGKVEVEWVVIPEIVIDGLVLKEVKAAVPSQDIGVSLLGQNALAQFQSVHISGDHLALQR